MKKLKREISNSIWICCCQHSNTSLSWIVDGNRSPLWRVPLRDPVAGLSPDWALLPNNDEKPQVLEDELPPTSQVSKLLLLLTIIPECWIAIAQVHIINMLKLFSNYCSFVSLSINYLKFKILVNLELLQLLSYYPLANNNYPFKSVWQKVKISSSFCIYW